MSGQSNQLSVTPELPISDFFHATVGSRGLQQRGRPAIVRDAPATFVPLGELGLY